MSYGVSKIDGTLRPILNHVLVTDMDFEEVKTAAGIVIPSQNGKSSGIKPRWGRVYAVGPEQKEVSANEWVFVEHGRWTRGITIEDNDGVQKVVRRVDIDAILMSADEKPADINFNNL